MHKARPRSAVRKHAARGTLSRLGILLAILFLLAACGDPKKPGTGPDPDPSARVTSVTISPATGTVQTGGTVPLKAEVAGSGNFVKTVRWSSADDGIATVSATGLVTGVSVGTTVISAASTATPTVTGTAVITVEAVPTVTGKEDLVAFTAQFYDAATTFGRDLMASSAAKTIFSLLDARGQATSPAVGGLSAESLGQQAGGDVVRLPVGLWTFDEYGSLVKLGKLSKPHHWQLQWKQEVWLDESSDETEFRDMDALIDWAYKGSDVNLYPRSSPQFELPAHILATLTVDESPLVELEAEAAYQESRVLECIMDLPAAISPSMLKLQKLHLGDTTHFVKVTEPVSLELGDTNLTFSGAVEAAASTTAASLAWDLNVAGNFKDGCEDVIESNLLMTGSAELRLGSTSLRVELGQLHYSASSDTASITGIKLYLNDAHALTVSGTVDFTAETAGSGLDGVNVTYRDGTKGTLPELAEDIIRKISPHQNE